MRVAVCNARVQCTVLSFVQNITIIIEFEMNQTKFMDFKLKNVKFMDLKIKADNVIVMHSFLFPNL